MLEIDAQTMKLDHQITKKKPQEKICDLIIQLFTS